MSMQIGSMRGGRRSAEFFYSSADGHEYNQDSKAFRRAFIAADRHCKRVFAELFGKKIPRNIALNLVKRYNSAARTYNSAREKFGEIEILGYDPARHKLFTLQERFAAAAQIFQSIGDTLKSFPDKRYVTHDVRPHAQQLLTVRNVRRLGLGLATAVVLTACAPEAAPIVEQSENETANQQENENQSLMEITSEGQEIDPATVLEAPTLTPEEQKIQDIQLKTETDVDASINADPILHQINTDGNLPEEIKPLCIEFATKLDAGRPGQGSYIDVFAATNIFSVGVVDGQPYCYVTTADGTIIVDAENKDGFLYLSPAIASQALGVQVARVSADGRHGSIGDAYDAEGRRVGGVSRLTMQWETVNADGVLPSEADPSSVPPTPVNPEESNLYQVNYAPAIDAEAQAQAMANLATAYENGDVTAEEIDKMSFEKRKEFSIALNEYRNKLDGEHSVTYTDESGKILYLGPDGKFHPEPQTTETRKPIAFDDEGFIHVFDNDDWIKIAGSQNIQFDDFENFPWPKTEIAKSSGLPVPESGFKHGDRSMLPVIVLSKELGEMNIFGFNNGSLTVYIVNSHDRFSVRRVILTGNMGLFGDNLAARSPGKLAETSPFWQKLAENSLYYLQYYTNQKEATAMNYPKSNGAELTDNHIGIVPTSTTHLVITGQVKSQKMIWINGISLVLPTVNP